MPALPATASPPSVRIAGKGGATIGWQVAAALLSAVLLTNAFPAPDHGWLAWVALVPLLTVCRNVGAARAFAIGAASGVATAYGIFNWLLEVPAFGAPQAILLAAYVALYPALWCAALPSLARSPMPLVVTAPAAWVVLDYARAHAGFLALPWASLAHSQHDNIAVLQLSALTGEAGVTALIVACNVAIAGVAIRERRAGSTAVATALAIAVVHAVGALHLVAPTRGPQVAVAAIQPSITLAERETAAGREAIFARLAGLTANAAASGAAIVVWPETAIGDPRVDAALAQELGALAQRTRATLVVGAAETEKFASADGNRIGVRRQDKYNSAYVVDADAPLSEPYRKRRLVPFGEYEPLTNVWSWPRWLVPAIESGVPGIPDPEPLHAGNVAIGALICWENLFADLSRGSVARGAELLVQLTNDVWFGATGASAQHNLASVLRAVENRTPIVLASNSGPSQIIDGSGRVVASVPHLFAKGYAIARVSLRGDATVYSRVGDWLVLVAGVCLALGFALPRLKASGSRLPSQLHRSF